MSNNPILFISYYFETLKAYRPYIENLEDVYVYATSHSIGKDYERTFELLEEMGVNYEINHSINRVDDYSYTNKNKIIEYISTVINELNTKFLVDRMLTRIKPSIIVVAADKRELERLVIRKAKELKIKTICLQWSLGPISEKALIENKYETLLADYKHDVNKSSNLHKTLSKLSLIYRRFLGLNTKVFANCYGGGDADILAVMGRGSKDFFIKQGVSQKKIRILGNALVERQIIKQGLSLDRSDVLNKVGLKKADKFILYCTGYLKPGYFKYTKKGDLFFERKKKIIELLNATEGFYIVVKLHPREILSEFENLNSISSRVIVIKDIDVNLILPFCELLFTRQSTTVIYALSYTKPVLTHDVPSMPMGSYYKDIGGTIHADSIEEIGRYANLILSKDSEIHMLIEEKRKNFMFSHLNIDENLNERPGDILPAVENFHEIIEDFD